MSANSHLPSLVYRIDEANCLVWMNTAWTEFAQQNHGEKVMPAKIIGHDLFASITDESVRQIYASIIQRARSGRGVAFNYRCDAPDKRRLFAMKVSLVDSGEVEFISTLINEEPRPSIALLEPGQERMEEFLHVCSWCQKVRIPDGAWVPVEAAVDVLHLLEAEIFPRITHGMCPACETVMMATLTDS